MLREREAPFGSVLAADEGPSEQSAVAVAFVHISSMPQTTITNDQVFVADFQRDFAGVHDEFAAAAVGEVLFDGDAVEFRIDVSFLQ
ncbi:MAG: hypothetical protein AMXMBFR7_45040 [Planctomycetota bacterium]